MNVSKSLRLAMAQIGINQAELARRSGVSRMSIAGVMKGTSNPTIGLLDKLAEHCGLTLVELLKLGEPIVWSK